MRHFTLLAFAAAAVFAAAGCGSPEPDEPEAPSGWVQDQMEDAGPVHGFFGDTLEVVSTNPNSAGARGEYTLDNPRRADDGDLIVDVNIRALDGPPLTPGALELLTTEGYRLEPIAQVETTPGSVSDEDCENCLIAGNMLSGERRTGYLVFDLTAESGNVAQIILFHGTLYPPVAIWEAEQ